MGDIHLLDPADLQFRYNCVVRLDIVGMLAGALASDYYWTDRVTLIPDYTYAFLDRAS